MTSSLMTQMNRNRNHVKIKRCRSWYNTFLWPRCLRIFAKLVGNWRPRDFKCTQSFNRGSCPYGCPRTVTLFGRPVNYIMYQETSFMAGLDGLPVFVVGCCCMLLTKFKREELMTPRIKMLSKLEWICGIVLASHQGFAAVIIKIRSLNLHATSGCRRCYTRY